MWNKRGIKHAPRKEDPSGKEKVEVAGIHEDDGKRGKDEGHRCNACAASQESLPEILVV